MCKTFSKVMAKLLLTYFIAKESMVIRNGKTVNLAKLDAHAFFISNAFFKSASPVDTGLRPVPTYWTYIRRSEDVQDILALLTKVLLIKKVCILVSNLMLLIYCSYVNYNHCSYCNTWGSFAVILFIFIKDLLKS